MRYARAFHCWLEGFIETWLDPWAWKMRLRGFGIEVQGHRFDLTAKRFQVEGEREYIYQQCARCGAWIRQGWRRWYGA
jgi:hypothetical protein